MSTAPSRIPSPDTLLPLPATAARFVQLARDWLPCDHAGQRSNEEYLAYNEVVTAAHAAVALVERARQEMGDCYNYRVIGWGNSTLVLACLDRLQNALRAVLEQLGWKG